MKKITCIIALYCAIFVFSLDSCLAASRPVLPPIYLLLLNSPKTTLDTDDFLKDAAGILAEQPVEQVAFTREEDMASTESTVIGGIMEAWQDKIADTDNAHSLMGFIEKEVRVFLKALDASGWYYEKQGSGILELSRDSETVALSYYSTPMNVAGGHAAMIYLGRTAPYNYAQFPYRSDTPLPFSDEGDNSVILIKEAAGKKLLYWVTMEKYADMPDSAWSVAGDFVMYQRTADTSQRIFPVIHRAKDGAGGGQAILLMTDSVNKETYFEYLISTEKENNQEHLVIRLTDLADVEGKLRIDEESKIHLSYVARQYFTTTLDNQVVNLVNDKDPSLVVQDLVQGVIRSGMKYVYSDQTLGAPLCINLPASLNINDVQLSSACSADPLTLPSIISDFTEAQNDPPSFMYLPSAGSVYSDIDLRVNMHNLFTADYDESWIGSLDVEN